VKKPPEPIGQAKPKLKINQPRQTPSSPQVRMHRRLWLVAKVAFGFVVALVGLVSGIYGIWGPPWPTDPVFVPGVPSLGDAFNVPFSVVNKSALFPLRDLELSCSIHSVATSHNNQYRRFSVEAGSREILRPLESRPYACLLNSLFVRSPDDTITAAEIEFVSDFSSWLPWRGRVHSLSGVFTLNTKTVPPQWMMGRPMK
jgi:hypothetical protein